MYVCTYRTLEMCFSVSLLYRNQFPSCPDIKVSAIQYREEADKQRVEGKKVGGVVERSLGRESEV